MRSISVKNMFSRRVALGLAASFASIGGPKAATEEPKPYILEIGDVSAKVGDPAVMVVKLRVRDGYRILKAYNHHVSQLSSWDDGVAFANKWVTATNDNGALVFAIDVRSTKPGKHPINGVLRFGYIQSSDSFSTISVPLIANVIGTE